MTQQRTVALLARRACRSPRGRSVVAGNSRPEGFGREDYRKREREKQRYVEIEGEICLGGLRFKV